ncbi:MAG: hypothetical protein IKT52_00665 [Oscillospiraceae bacterium]|nr:hypothetical protein [Oscillospiraceae bacterium]
MKKLITFVFVFVFVLCLGGCSKAKEETVSFHNKTFHKSDLSEETLEWLEWYNQLNETQQLSISYIPSDLYKLSGYCDVEDAPAETE